MTIYRETTIGSALRESLDELKDQMTEDLVKKILESFDQVICKKFEDVQTSNKIKLNGKCVSYNNVDDVWLFYLSSLSIKGDDIYEDQVPHCRIVATNTENKEGATRREPTKRAKKGNQGMHRGGARRWNWASKYDSLL